MTTPDPVREAFERKYPVLIGDESQGARRIREHFNAGWQAALSAPPPQVPADTFTLPSPPTKAMLVAMVKATFLNDMSELEMERRYNGLLDWLRRYGKRASPPPQVPIFKARWHWYSDSEGQWDVYEAPRFGSLPEGYELALVAASPPPNTPRER